MAITIKELIHKLQALPGNMKCGVTMVTEQEIMVCVSDLDYMTPTDDQMDKILDLFHDDSPLDTDSMQITLDDAGVEPVSDDDEEDDEDDDYDDHYDDDDYEPEVDEDYDDADDEEEGVDVD
jgi:hypothetical protein